MFIGILQNVSKSRILDKLRVSFKETLKIETRVSKFHFLCFTEIENTHKKDILRFDLL